MKNWGKVIIGAAVIVNVLLAVATLLFVAMCSDISNTYAEILKLY